MNVQCSWVCGKAGLLSRFFHTLLKTENNEVAKCYKPTDVKYTQ
jgi:hypothetical protein